MNAPISPSRLLHYLDDLKILVHPLPNHYAFECESTTREAYATFLAVVLLCEPVIAESQERLFRMLLASLGLDGQEARILEAAQLVDRPFLQECARQFGDEMLSRSFMTDIAVLLRLAGPLSDAQQVMLSELADFLRLREADVALAANIAATVLGRPADENTFGDLDTTEFVVWKEFLGCELTAQRLAAGVDGGVWRVSSGLEMSTSWSLANCTVLFSRDGRIDTTSGKGKEVAVSIEGCTLEAPVMTFDKISSLTVKTCDTVGHYVESDQISAFSVSECVNVSINTCTFTTHGARALRAVLTPLLIHKCHFHECGNATLIGGAISVQRHSSPRGARLSTEEGHKFAIANSRFTHCKALLGGAIRADSLHHSISACKFESCTSEGYNDEFHQAGVFVDHAGSQAIRGSTFRENHLRLGCCYDGGSRHMVFDSRFIGSNVYYHDRYHNNTVLSQCTLEAAKSIDKELLPEDWWYDY